MLKKIVMNKAKSFFIVGVSFFCFIAFAGSVHAIQYGGFGGKPAFPRPENPRTESIFVHTLEPGAVQNEGVSVINNSSEQKTILVYAVDSTPSTGGGFACEQMSEVKDNVGSWITLEKSEVTLESTKSEIVPFVINVPLSAGVGEHNGCIIIQEKKIKPDGKSGVSLSFRSGLRVAITIPGTLERKLEIAGFTIEPKENGDFVLKPKVKNLGNVSIDADALVTTQYFFGLNYVINGGQYPILRGDTSDWNFEMKKPFWGGWYRSSFTVGYDANPEAGVGVKSGKGLEHLVGPSILFFSFPTLPALAIESAVVLFFLLCLVLVILSLKRKSWIKRSWTEYEILPEDDIMVLSKKFDVSWKLLAKANKLKPPYMLTLGEKIKVPPLK